MEGYVDEFDALAGDGAAEGILLTVENKGEAEDEGMADRLRACSGFFFTGGSQSRIGDVFLPDGKPTAAYQALWERYQAGAVVAGSSAGAAIMSDPMIAGGSSVGALREGVRMGGEGDGVWLTRGLGFLKRGLVDQHFLARGRWGRLLVSVLASPDDSLGFGIDENTALVVEGDSAWVVGESGVLFLDARSAVREDEGNGGYGVRAFLLGEGDRVDLQAGIVRSGEGKDPLPGTGGPFASPDLELFSGGSLLRVLAEFAVSSDRRLTFHQEGHFMEFRKEPGFKAMGRGDPSAGATAEDLSLGPFVLSVWRE
jgi:cyanophycinase